MVALSLSLYVLCCHFVCSLETAAHSWEMLSVWTCDNKAHDKMAFLCLYSLGSHEQLVAEGGLGQSGKCGIVDV